MYLAQLYSLIPTGVPIVLYSLFDKEFQKEHLVNNPKLYLDSASGKYFNRLSFWRSIALAVCHSAFIFFMLYTTTSKPLDKEGHMASLYMFGNSLYVYVCILVNMQLLTESYNLTFLTGGVIFLSMFSSIALYLMISLVPNNPIYHTFKIMFTNATYFSILFMSTVANLLTGILANRVRGAAIFIVDKVKDRALPTEILDNKPPIENSIDLTR